jgi:enamine deaminase RidA (YjgF/YER057c/UK114 family)
MRAQAEYVLDTIEAILAAHGATFDNVVNIRSFLTDLDLIGEYGAARRPRFTGKPPTSTTVEVTRLFVPGALIEVEVVAVV